jgi:hypothetical protein
MSLSSCLELFALRSPTLFCLTTNENTDRLNFSAGGIFDYDLDDGLEEETDKAPELASRQPSVAEIMYKYGAQILNSQRDKNTTKITAREFHD